MKTVIIANTEVTLTYATINKTSSYGHYKVLVHLDYKDNKEVFSKTITDAEFFDKINAIEDADEKDGEIFDYIMYGQFEENVIDWLYEVDARYYIVAYYGEKSEFYAGTDNPDGAFTNLKENALQFETYDDAKDALKDVIEYWNENYTIDATLEVEEY